MTSYHENGQIKQYLEIIGGRAKGRYQEWYENGNPKVILHVIEGIGDLGDAALQSFMLDGMNKAFDENGYLCAEYPYEKGVLQGEALLLYPGGKIKKRLPFVANHLHGKECSYDLEGNVLGFSEYKFGQLHGKLHFLGNAESPKFEELYENGRLIEGDYFDFSLEPISRVSNGSGIKTTFEQGFPARRFAIHNGQTEGKVEIFDDHGFLVSFYHMKNREKHGEEQIFFAQSTQPKMQLSWYEGEIHGIVRTWYANGKLESEKELSHNQKHGMNFAWYRDGNLMLVEEYEEDRLMKGSYYKRGDAQPISKVLSGVGVATIFDSDGYFLRKTEYQNGQPFES